MTTTQYHKVVWADDRLPEQKPDIRLTGSGIAVDLLGAILARGGLRVRISPPAGPVAAEPVGVNTVPYTAELLYLLADRFRVPEIADLAMFGRLPEWLKRTSGIKQSLGFVYHRARTAHDRQQNVQFSVPGEHAEWHAYLPEVGGHTRLVAEQYGVRYAPAAEVEDAGDEGGLGLACAGNPAGVPAGREIGGVAYFDGVSAFEQLRPPRDGGYTEPWSEGSVTHGFRGGWVHLAAFGNHPAARNHGCAVSLRLEAGHPDAGADLDEVLAKLARRYPDIGLQLDGGQRIGQWAHTDADAQRTGEPVLALDLSRGEALFGQDFTLALELVHAAGAILLEPGALASAESADAAVQAIGRFQRSLLETHDRVTAAALVATRSFASWDAFLRTWLLWSISSALALKKVRVDAVRSGNWQPASKFDRGVGWFDLAPGIWDIVSRSMRTIETIQNAGVQPTVAAGRVFSLLSRRRVIPPLYKFGRPEARRYQLNLATRLKLLAWTFTVAPKAYRGMLTADNITAIPNEEAERVQ
ncbi:MAG: hypothetical protein M3Y42_09910 [Actinomycetota bacterium]|nr:hypothetical protein [Actinomycetota bacterium]MDQ2957266.1 hypothetical protein [Actinomycetota bacterium]